MFPTPASPHCRKRQGLRLCCVLGLSPVQPAVGLAAKGQERAEGLRDALGRPTRGRSSEGRGRRASPRRPVLRGQGWGGDTGGAWTAAGCRACIRRSWGPQV